MHPRTTYYNHAHDAAQRLKRRHELDLHWAKEQRRQQERRLAEARALVAAGRGRLYGVPVLAGLAASAVAVALAWEVVHVGLLGAAWVVAPSAAAALGIAILSAVAVSLVRLHGRRQEARRILHAREARLAHTQYHIEESLGGYLDAHLLTHATR